MLALQRRRSYQGPRGGSATGGRASDTISVSDSSATRIIALHLTGIETIVESDMAEKHPLQRTSSDTVSASETATRIVSLLRRPTADVVPIGDFADIAQIRSATDTVSVGDSGTHHVGVNPHDTTAVGDAATRIVSLHVTASDAVASSDLAHRTYFGNASDAVAVSEGTHHVGLRPADAAAVSDSAQRLIPGQRSSADSVSVSDTAISGPVVKAPKPIYNGIAARRQRGGVGMFR